MMKVAHTILHLDDKVGGIVRRDVVMMHVHVTVHVSSMVKMQEDTLVYIYLCHCL